MMWLATVNLRTPAPHWSRNRAVDSGLRNEMIDQFHSLDPGFIGWIWVSFCSKETIEGITGRLSYCWWQPEIRLTSWGWWFIPLFMMGFIHPRWWLFGISEPSTVSRVQNWHQTRGPFSSIYIFTSFTPDFLAAKSSYARRPNQKNKTGKTVKCLKKPTQLRPFARHLVGKIIAIFCDPLLITKHSPV